MQEDNRAAIAKYVTFCKNVAAAALRNSAIQRRDWPLVFLEHVPQQGNGIDCGVYAIMMMEYLGHPRSGVFMTAADVRQDMEAAQGLRKVYGWEDFREPDVTAMRHNILTYICKGSAYALRGNGYDNQWPNFPY